MKKHIISIITLGCAILLIGGGCANSNNPLSLNKSKPEKLSYPGTWELKNESTHIQFVLEQEDDSLTGYHKIEADGISQSTTPASGWSIIGRIQEDNSVEIDITDAVSLEVGSGMLTPKNENEFSIELRENITNGLKGLHEVTLQRAP